MAPELPSSTTPWQSGLNFLGSTQVGTGLASYYQRLGYVKPMSKAVYHLAEVDNSTPSKAEWVNASDAWHAMIHDAVNALLSSTSTGHIPPSMENGMSANDISLAHARANVILGTATQINNWKAMPYTFTGACTLLGYQQNQSMDNMNNIILNAQVANEPTSRLAWSLAKAAGVTKSQWNAQNTDQLPDDGWGNGPGYVPPPPKTVTNSYQQQYTQTAQNQKNAAWTYLQQTLGPNALGGTNQVGAILKANPLPPPPPPPIIAWLGGYSSSGDFGVM